MVEQRERLDLVFRALSDPTRRAMLDVLRERECSIVELAEPFEMSLAGASKHVQVLARAGLIERRKEGRTQYCRLQIQALRQAHEWLQQYASFWNARLDQLEQVLKNEKMQKGNGND